MWPILLDMTKDECKRTLRRLELEAYGNMVSALRAQGGLNTDKHKLLQDIATALNIPQERHRAEVRRAVNDERLTTIAHCMTGDDTSDEWALEGRRLVPLMPRLVPQTAYSVIADDEANKVSLENEKLPLPANTERKRPLQTNIPESLNKNVHFRIPSEGTPKTSIQNNIEDMNSKKRKSINMESSSLAQHLIMGQPKISRVQQLYRQKTKALLKSQMKHRVPPPIHPINTTVQKLNIMKSDEDVTNTNTTSEVPISKPLTGDSNKVINPIVTNPPSSNENSIPKPKPTVIHTSSVKSGVQSTNNLVSQQTPIVSSTSEVAQKSIKICPARKVITSTAKTQSTSQKVIIVSTSQGTTTSSILQRTLTIPFVKTISMKNLDKVKVINNPVTLQSTSGTTNVSNAVSQKPKLYAVKGKSGTPTKHVSIPFIQGVQLQALQSKGAIKMVPLTTTAKSSKSAVISTSSGSVYIMNSNTTLPIVTTSNSSPVVTPKTDTRVPVINSETQETETNNIFILKTDEKKPNTIVNNEESSENIETGKVQKIDSKSSVLAEIMKASGVLPNDETEHTDIESQITQLTEIPNTNIPNEIVHNDMIQSEVIQDQVVQHELIKNDILEQDIEAIDTCMETVIQENSQDTEQFQQMMNSSPNSSNFVIVQENAESTEMILDDTQQTNEEVVELMGSLDPETGMYSMKTPQEYELMEEVENNQAQMTADSYVIEMESLNNSDLDMPSLSN